MEVNYQFYDALKAIKKTVMFELIFYMLLIFIKL